MASAQASKYENPVINQPAQMKNRCGASDPSPVWSRSAREVRAVALAARYGTSAGWTRYYTGAADGSWELLKVQSRTDCTKHYLVTYSPRTDTVLSCDCPAMGVCWHRGSARLWIERRKVRAAMAERAAESERQYRYYDSLEA